MRHSLLVAGGLLFVFAVSLGAQGHVFDLRLLELNDGGDRTYHNFIYARTFAEGKIMFEAFHLRIPQDDYKEFTAGVAYNAKTIGDFSLYLFGHLATASDEEYFEPALFALDVDGKITGSLFLLYYVPLGNDGVNQWLIDPFELQYNVAGPLSVGISGYFYRPEGGPSVFKKGGKLSVTDQYGASEVAVRHVNNHGGFEFQFRRIIIF